MAFLCCSRLFGLLFLLTLPLDGAAALALVASQQQPQASSLSLEGRLQRIAEAMRERHPQAGPAGAVPEDALSYVFVNAPGLGWGNGGFRNGGFYNGGFRNGGFYNGGFRNGGGWGNGGFRNGGFRNAW